MLFDILFILVILLASISTYTLIHAVIQYRKSETGKRIIQVGKKRELITASIVTAGWFITIYLLMFFKEEIVAFVVTNF